MPFIIWVALAMSILLVGASAALTVQDAPESIKPIVEASSGAFDILGYALALAVVMLTVFYMWKKRKPR